MKGKAALYMFGTLYIQKEEFCAVKSALFTKSGLAENKRFLVYLSIWQLCYL